MCFSSLIGLFNMTKTHTINQLLHTIALLLIVSVSHAQPLDASFTYQGKLKYQGQLANGSFDLQFELYDVATEGVSIANTIQLDDIIVNNGVFIVELDFTDPTIFSTQTWIAVSVREGNSVASYTLLSPREKIKTVPYTLHTESMAINSVGSDAINSNEIQLRINQSCDADSSIQSIDANGNVTCQDDSVGLTTVTSQDITDGTITALDIDNTTIQQRITGSCPTDYYLISINPNGTVICASFPYLDD